MSDVNADGGIQYWQELGQLEHQQWLQDKAAQAEYLDYLDELEKGEQHGMESNRR